MKNHDANRTFEELPDRLDKAQDDLACENALEELEEEEMDVGDRKMFKVYRKTELNDQYKSR